jgi:heme exporter protein D
MRGQADANRYVKQLLYTLGGTLGGAAAGLLFAALGVLVGDDPRTAIASAAIAVAAMLGVWEAAGRRARLLQLDQETPQRWMHFGPIRWPLANGAALGFAVTSRLGFPLWYVLPILSFASGTLWFGPLLWSVYGASRTSLAWLVLRVMRQRRPDAVLDGLVRLQPPLRRVAGALLIVDAVVLATVAVQA